MKWHMATTYNSDKSDGSLVTFGTFGNLILFRVNVLMDDNPEWERQYAASISWVDHPHPNISYRINADGTYRKNTNRVDTISVFKTVDEAVRACEQCKFRVIADMLEDI